MTEYQTITFEQSGPITRITLNRPDAANGMNDTMTRELADAAKRCDTNATKVVVLTGSGRFFCAGGDLKSFAAAATRGPFIKGVADDLHRAISTFARMEAVLITSVNGVAAAPDSSRRDGRPGAFGGVRVVHDGLHARRFEPRRQLVLLPAEADGHHQNKELMLTQPGLCRSGSVAEVTEVVPDAELPPRR